MKEVERLPIAFLNGTIATTNGVYSIKDIDVEHIKELLKEYPFISAIGHEATAEVISEVLGREIPYNRIQFYQGVGQKAIVFKLNERPPEGVILDKKSIEAIGYSFKVMERLE